MKKYLIPMFCVLLGCGEHALDEFLSGLLYSSSSNDSDDVSSSSGGGGNSGGVGDFTDTSGTFVDSRDGTSYKWVKIGEQVWITTNLNYNTSGSKCYGEGGRVIIYDNICNIIYDNAGNITYTTLSNTEIQANCTKYGRLYDWATAMALPSKCNNVLSTSDTDCAIRTPHRGICPSGYHIPSRLDWIALVNYIESVNGCDYWVGCAGKYLKTASGWMDYLDIINVVIKSGNGRDKYGFAALPGGYGPSDGSFDGVEVGSFDGIGMVGIWWSASEASVGYAYCESMSSSLESEGACLSVDKSSFLSVRCVKD